MATSRIPNHLLRDPFQRPTLTPGPLGHNDFASPESPHDFVGDTPGPLGKNDHADPIFMTTMKKKASTGSPGIKKGELRKLAMLMSISDRGVRFIWSEEYVVGISERLHWPRGASGVTLGAGYDMKCRSKTKIEADLISVGLSQKDSEKAAEGAGLKGDEAEEFVYRNKDLFCLSEAQSHQLLKLTLKTYEIPVKNLVKAPLLQHEFDALVSFAYNPAGRLGSLIKCINKGMISEGMRIILESNTSGKSVLKGLSARRIREVNLYTGGKYNR